MVPSAHARDGDHAVTAPIVIDPAAIYHDGTLRLALDLPSATLARARREGRLRFTRQGGRVLYRGQWILDWLEADALATKEAAHAQ
jgi:hypothetical protein